MMRRRFGRSAPSPLPQRGQLRTKSVPRFAIVESLAIRTEPNSAPCNRLCEWFQEILDKVSIKSTMKNALLSPPKNLSRPPASLQMSLFSQLRQLYRPDRFQFEDFHTEIVAQVLVNSHALTLAWLQGIKATTLVNAVSIKVKTQETFDPLPGHSTPSRPDIVIRLSFGERKELIFIESKQDSKQGHDQLARYADHLSAARQREGLQNVSLVFITRDYEAAPPLLMKNPILRLARWFEFYRYLKVYVNDDGLANQLKLFMEENRMSLGNKFRSTDFVALENFLSAKALMDETLSGEVAQAVGRIFGGFTSVGKAPNQLRDEGRYTISNNNWNTFQCHLGYWLPHENPDLPIWVGIKFYSRPWVEARKQVIEAFSGWCGGEAEGWSAWGLDDEGAWSCISKGKSLQSLTGESDHVNAVKNHFLALLKEVEELRGSYPKLPWGAPNPAGTPVEDENPSGGK